MKFRKLRKNAVIITVLIIAGVVSFGIGASTTYGNKPPLDLPWERPDGTIDMEKLPECFKVVGSDGQTILDPKGKPVCIPSKDLFAPPLPKPPLQNESEGFGHSGSGGEASPPQSLR
jgi:hypothetical protein